MVTMSPVPPVFIVGSGRCGSTLLRLMLITKSNLMIPDECDFLWRSALTLGAGRPMDGATLESFLRIVRDISSFPKLGIPFTELRAEVLGKQPHTLAEALETVYAYHATRHGRSRWGDKNPFYVLYLDLVVSLFPDARVVHLVRDARDVALSYSKTRMRPHNFYLAAMRWKHCLDRGQVWGRSHPRQYLQVKYESLIENPEMELKRVCEFIGEEFHVGMFDFHHSSLTRATSANRDHHVNLTRPLLTTNKEKWRSEMSAVDIRIVEAVAGDRLVRLGYPLSESRSPAWLNAYLGTCRLRYALGRRETVRRVATGSLYWRLRKLVKKAALIDNAHYRWPPDMVGVSDSE